MSGVKKADVAGTFYPDNPRELSNLIEGYLREGKESLNIPRAIVAPHAGYIFSGPVAGSVYKAAQKLKGKVKNIILLSPAHRYYVEGIAAHQCQSFETPLGNLDVNMNLLNTLSDLHLPCDDAFFKEHGLETHLPFLAHIFGLKIKILPFIVGNTTQDNVYSLLNRLWDDTDNFFVISSDLSHFHDYETCRMLDKATSSIIENLESKKLQSDFACGFYPLRGLLKLAKEKKVKAKTIDLRNSGDTAGNKDQVVGYGGYVFFD